MRQINLESETNEDGETDATSRQLTLMITVVELFAETMGKGAIRQIESGMLDPEESERLGTQLYTRTLLN